MRISGISKRAFQAKLVRASCGCVTQHTGWPCNTCFFADKSRTQEQWHAVLAYRGDSEHDRTIGGYRMASGIKFHDDGTFAYHEFTFVPIVNIRQRIRQLWEVIK